MDSMNNFNKKDALGKGIRSLLQNIDSDLKNTSTTLNSDVSDKSMAVNRINLDRIETNPNQPRKDFDQNALKELSESIKLHNIIQPLTVRPIAGGKYRLIAGERRYRASKMAGLTDVPVYIRHNENDDLLELALLENLQREDLNAMEIANSCGTLMDELGYTQEQVADRLGKDRSTVANYLRLLKLPAEIQEAIRTNIITMGHAKAISGLDTREEKIHVFTKIKSQGLSVRQTETLVRELSKPTSVKPSTKTKELSNDLRAVRDNLISKYATNKEIRITLSHDAEQKKGEIVIKYHSVKALNELLENMNIKMS